MFIFPSLILSKITGRFSRFCHRLRFVHSDSERRFQNLYSQPGLNGIFFIVGIQVKQKHVKQKYFYIHVIIRILNYKISTAGTKLLLPGCMRPPPPTPGTLNVSI